MVLLWCCCSVVVVVLPFLLIGGKKMDIWKDECLDGMMNRWRNGRMDG